MNKKKKIPAFVKFSIVTTITVVVWVGFEIYRAITLKPDPVVPPAVLRQISPELDAFALQKLQNRLYISEDNIADTTIILPEEESEEVLEEEVVIEDEPELGEDDLLIEEDEI